MVTRRPDTAAVVGYLLYESGQVVETFDYSDSGLQFSSKLRDAVAHEINDAYKFADDFFREQDAFEPGITLDYFLSTNRLSGSMLQAGEQVRVLAPGFVLVVDGESVISRPHFERVDYVALS